MIANPALDSFAHWAEVVHRIRRGEEEGVEDLYAELSQGVCARLFRNIDAQSVEDRIHEVLVIVLEAIRNDDLRDPLRLMGFIRTVARRQVAAHLRGTIAQRRRFASVDVEASAPRDQSPEARSVLRERVAGVQKRMLRLKARDREILERFYLLEQDPNQICVEMSLTETQFRLYKSRAIAVLRASA